MKKLFHIAINSDHYDSSGIGKGFEQNGYEVIYYNWQTKRYDLGTEQMRIDCASEATAAAPDLIFMHCQNPDAFDKNAVVNLQAVAPVIHYTFDVREDIRWYKEIAPHVAMTLFACHEDVNSCKSDGILNVAYMPSSADFDVYKPILALDGVRAKFPEIVFIGDNHVGTNLNYPNAKQRQDMIGFMHDEYTGNFMSFGQGQKGGRANRSTELEIYSRAKIVITHNNFLRKGYCSDRDFRAVGCGKFVIHQFFDGVKEMFGWQTAVWMNFNDIKYTCDYFLRPHKREEREMIATREHDHVIALHSWSQRVSSILNLLKLQEA